MKKYKVGDIVLIKSVAGDIIPKIHVRLVERVVVKGTPEKIVGFKKIPGQPGYSGWDAVIVYQSEAELLRKKWSIPFQGPGDSTFVYDDCIIKRSTLKENVNVKKAKRRKKVERPNRSNNNHKPNRRRVRNKNKES